MAQTMAEYLIEKGKEQGIQLAIQLGIELSVAQGIEQGRMQVKQADILKILRLRFHTIPESVADKIYLIQSLSRLDSLLEQAVTAKTLDEIDFQIPDG